MNSYRLLLSALIVGTTLLVATEVVVKKTKVGKRTESTAAVREDCCELLADILELCNAQARSALNLQAKTMNIIRSWLAAESDCCLTTASKESLKSLREKLHPMKQRLLAMEAEIEQYKKELALFEATSVVQK